MFLQHNINGVMYRKEEDGDSFNNKLERQSRTEFVSNCESYSVLNNFELCYRDTGTSWSRGGSVIAAVFLAHNYVSEQFGNYVEYGMLTNVAVNSLGELVSLCLTPLLILIFSLSLCRCTVTELSVYIFQDFYVHIFYSLFLQ